MAKFLSDRQQSLKVGISSYTENNTVLQTIGKVGIGTTNATQLLDINGNVKISGGIYDSNNNVGVGGSILVSTGSGLSWTAPYAAGLQGVQGTQGLQGLQGLQGVQGLSNQGTQGLQGLQGVQGLSNQGTQGTQGAASAQGTQGTQGAAAAQGAASAQGTQGTQGAAGPSTTINAADDISSTTLYPVMVEGTGSNQTVKARSTATAFSFNASTNVLSAANIFVGAATSTGTASQPLQVTGGAYISGNVGIGRTDPIAKLQISDGGILLDNNISATLSASQNYIGFGTNSVSRITGRDNNTSLGFLAFLPGGIEAARFNDSGNLGIGTTNPQYPLQVQGNARITGAVYDSTNSPGTSGQVLQSTVSGTQWTTAAAGGGGSGKFDTSIDNVLYVQPTGTLDIVGVGTTTSQITTLTGSSPEYLIHSIHVTNISNGDAEITAGFIMNGRKVPATLTNVSTGYTGGPGIHTITVGSASSITVGMAVTGTGNIGETTGIGSTAGFQYNTYVTSVDGNKITLSKPMSGIASGTLFFSPVSDVVSRLPVPVGSAVELLKQPMVLASLDSIVLQSTGAGSGVGSTSTSAISQTSGSNFLTVTVGAAITNFLASGMLIGPTGTNTGIQTNTFVGVGYTPGSLRIPMTRPATTSLASTSLSFTEVVVPQDGALQTTIVYQSSTDTSYQNGTGTVVGIVTLASLSVPGVTSTTPSVYYSSGNVYPSIVQSIRVANISDSTIYPGGDYSVSVGIGNSDTIFSYLAYNMVIPRNSSIELCEAPKRIGIGQSIFAFSNTANAIEIQIAGKQKI